MIAMKIIVLSTISRIINSFFNNLMIFLHDSFFVSSTVFTKHLQYDSSCNMILAISTSQSLATNFQLQNSINLGFQCRIHTISQSIKMFGPPGFNQQIAGNFHKFDKWNVPNNWCNPHKIYVPQIEFHKQCKKCHGSGAINYKGTFYPCRKCYKHKGYCVTCYGTGRSYMTGRHCPNCSGHGKYNNKFRGHNHPPGWGEWSDSD